MATIVSDSSVAAGRMLRLPNGGEYVKRVYVGGFEKPSTPDPFQPQIFSVGQLPDTVVEPHYHAVDQWQVFVDGNGMLGRHPALPGSLHYVDRNTGYGPIVAGSQGLTYFTIRAMSDPGAQFLHQPGTRERLKQARASTRRYLYVSAETVGPDLETVQPGEARLDPVLSPHADGLAAWVARIGPGAELVAPDARTSGGQVMLVLTGCALNDATMLPRLSCAFISDRDAPLRLSAAASGAIALLLQFPRLTLG